jgi:hypothetical protein
MTNVRVRSLINENESWLSGFVGIPGLKIETWGTQQQKIHLPWNKERRD